MSKSKVRSMQRGAQKRESEQRVTMQEIYANRPPKLSESDKPHLDFANKNPDHLNRVRTVVQAAKKNGIGKAGEISSLLNKLCLKTAAGENWTPRLAWFVAIGLKEIDRPGKPKGKALRGCVSHEESRFRDLVNRAVGLRLEEIRKEYDKSSPTYGDAFEDLSKLKIRLESMSDKS